MAGIGSTPEMNRLADTLTQALDELREVAQCPPSACIDAGSSTAEVTATVASLFDVTGGMVADLQYVANEIPNARTIYENSDQSAANELPLPLATEGT